MHLLKSEILHLPPSSVLERTAKQRNLQRFIKIAVRAKVKKPPNKITFYTKRREFLKWYSKVFTIIAHCFMEIHNGFLFVCLFLTVCYILTGKKLGETKVMFPLLIVNGGHIDIRIAGSIAKLQVRHWGSTKEPDVQKFQSRNLKAYWIKRELKCECVWLIKTSIKNGGLLGTVADICNPSIWESGRRNAFLSLRLAWATRSTMSALDT